MAGASGAVESDVLRLLLDDAEWEPVHSLVRRPSGTDQPKLIEHVVDFDDLDGHVGVFAGADVFCCLGTTTSQAGSREAFRKVDYGYVVKLAQPPRPPGRGNSCSSPGLAPAQSRPSSTAESRPKPSRLCRL